MLSVALTARGLANKEGNAQQIEDSRGARIDSNAIPTIPSDATYT